MHDVLEQLRGRLIVSCQAYPGEPMRDPRTMTQVAQAVVAGGAAAVRAQGLDDVRMVAEAVDVPVVGLWKDGDDGVYITPTPSGTPGRSPTPAPTSSPSTVRAGPARTV